MDARSRQLEDFFNHRKHMQDECMGALRIFTSFHASLETRFMHSSHISIKTQVLSNKPQANHFKFGILVYLKTLSKC